MTQQNKTMNFLIHDANGKWIRDARQPVARSPIPRASDPRQSRCIPLVFEARSDRPRSVPSPETRAPVPGPVLEPHSDARRPAANLRAHFPSRSGSSSSSSFLRVFGFPRSSEILTIANLASPPPLTILRCRLSSPALSTAGVNFIVAERWAIFTFCRNYLSRSSFTCVFPIIVYRLIKYDTDEIVREALFFFCSIKIYYTLIHCLLMTLLRNLIYKFHCVHSV